MIESKNAQQMKYFNRLNVLQIVATKGPISRTDIVNETGITKMTVSNISSDLIRAGYLSEIPAENRASNHAGRNPSLLSLSDESPCVLGIFIGRRYCVVQICNLSASIINEAVYDYDETLTADILIESICRMKNELTQQCSRKLICAGISAPGPVDVLHGIILNPPRFYGIENVPIVNILEERIGIPCKLIHDSSSAALAESLYGEGKSLKDYIYIIIQDGIGAGEILNGILIDGNSGLGGELGHTSIDINGIKCECGNRGCLEQYANDQSLIENYHKFGGIGFPEKEHHIFEFIINEAESGSIPAIKALEIFAEYLSCALINLLNMFSTENIILGYRGGNNNILEKILYQNLAERVIAAKYKKLSIYHSKFRNKGPVVGAVAQAVQQIFTGSVNIDLSPLNE